MDYTGHFEFDKVTLSGGAILIYGETTINNSRITGNSTSGGGAVLNSGLLTLQNSITSKNIANAPKTVHF